MPLFFTPSAAARESLAIDDAWTFCFKSLSLSLSAGAGRDRAKSETGLSSPVPDQQRSSSCFPVCFVGFPIAHLSFVPWRRQPCAGQPKPRPAGRRLRVGLPTPVKLQKMDRETLPWCSLPSNSSLPRAFSRCLNNRISKLAHRHSQPLHWISHRLDWFSTSPLGTTWSRLLRMPWVSTSQPGTMRHNSQGTISNAQLTQLISGDDAA